MKSAGFVSLKVYDSIGNLVATLVENYKQKGIHTITFEAKNLSSGVYYVRMQSGAFSDSKKLLILK